MSFSLLKRWLLHSYWHCIRHDSFFMIFVAQILCICFYLFPKPVDEEEDWHLGSHANPAGWLMVHGKPVFHRLAIWTWVWPISDNSSYHSGIKQFPFNVLFGSDVHVGFRSASCICANNWTTEWLWSFHFLIWDLLFIIKGSQQSWCTWKMLGFLK